MSGRVRFDMASREIVLRAGAMNAAAGAASVHWRLAVLCPAEAEE